MSLEESINTLTKEVSQLNKNFEKFFASVGSVAVEAGHQITTEKPKAEEKPKPKPKAEKPKAEKPKAEKPKAEKPKAEKPKAEKPKTKEPIQRTVEGVIAIAKEAIQKHRDKPAVFAIRDHHNVESLQDLKGDAINACYDDIKKYLETGKA